MLSTQYVLKRNDFFFNTVLRRETRTQVQLAASIIKLKRSRLGGRIELQQKCHLSAERTKQPNIITQHRLLESAIETTGLMFFISHRAHHQRETPPDDTGPKNTGPQPSRNCAPPQKKNKSSTPDKGVISFSYSTLLGGTIRNTVRLLTCAANWSVLQLSFVSSHQQACAGLHGLPPRAALCNRSCEANHHQNGQSHDAGHVRKLHVFCSRRKSQGHGFHQPPLYLSWS